MRDNPRNAFRSRTVKIPASLCFALLCLTAACSMNERDASAREWQRAECNKVIDSEDRKRCLKRADDYYGTRSTDPEADEKKPRR
jgi:hypothetical protein